MSDCIQVGNLQVARVLYDFINEQAISGTGVDVTAVWNGVDTLVHDLAPKNRELLNKRDDLHDQNDAWHKQRAGKAHDAAAYKAFLQEIGYLMPEQADF